MTTRPKGRPVNPLERQGRHLQASEDVREVPPALEEEVARLAASGELLKRAAAVHQKARASGSTDEQAVGAAAAELMLDLVAHAKTVLQARERKAFDAFRASVRTVLRPK